MKITNQQGVTSSCQHSCIVLTYFQALCDASIIWAFVVCCVLTFAQHSKLATALMLPILIWISFALTLNYSLVQLNPINNTTVLG